MTAIDGQPNHELHEGHETGFVRFVKFVVPMGGV
jgi:hypothetical protein